MEGNERFKFRFSFEYLDFARHSHEEGYAENIGNYLKLKYRNNSPDFIITQENLFDVITIIGKNIFPEVPVLLAWNGPRRVDLESHG